MEKHILFLRLSYWISAIADFVIAYVALVPERMGSTDIVYPMGLTSAIAFSWGVMLLIADRKPMERRWVLVPTILVVSMITVVRVVFALVDSMEFSMGLLLFGIALASFMAFSFHYANIRDTQH